MPDKALPMVLARLQSPNLAMRREAFGLLRHYPVTLQIDSAMKPSSLIPIPPSPSPQKDS